MTEKVELILTWRGMLAGFSTWLHPHDTAQHTYAWDRFAGRMLAACHARVII